MRQPIKSVRHSIVESLESRVLFNVDPLWVGGVYVEEDNGGDAHGDSFYVTFRGGAAGTQLTRVVIETDQGLPGFSSGDNLFDTVDSGLGSDHAFSFKMELLTAQSTSARVSAAVSDGDMQLVLTFENFFAGDKVKFSIDVDEIQRYHNEQSPDAINPNIDPITSGVEFADSKIKASFVAPHFEKADTEGSFVNLYDPTFAPTGLDLPSDDRAGLRDRTAGAAATVTQVPKPIELSGTVYVDNNLSLTQDANEVGIAGVSLTLFRLENGNYVSTGNSTTTDPHGQYQFGLNLALAPGTYQIRESQPAGYVSVGAVPGLLNDQPNLGNTVPGDKDVLTNIQILQGESRGTHLDFAEAQPVQISGFVYRDNNDNSRRESDEAGIVGIDIQIISIETIATPVSLATRTLADGSYRFIGLPPGRYRISELSQPVDYFDGKDSPGTVRGQIRGNSSTNDQITEIRLDGNDNGIEFNFGEIEPSSLSGHVCVAMPGFECFSTEPNSKSPLPSVKVDLVNAAGTMVASTVTVADGSYRFDRLPAGVYSIVETQPANWLDGLSRSGTINGVAVGSATNGTRIEQISLGGGQQGVSYDFCELPPSTLSGHVYRDDNNDGVRQNSEPTLPGATIRLFDSTGGLMGEVATDAQGYYHFTSLHKGTYRLAEITPAGYLDGKESIGRIAGRIVGEIDGSDAIKSVVLPSGMDGIDYDFGEILPASISGNVYEDADGDCVRDPDEVNLSGVLIEILDAQGQVAATTRTDASGNYQFLNLTPGVYMIREQQPTGYIQGGQKAGSSGGDASLADIISSIALGAGVQATNYDFCEQRVASLEGRVFADLNEDCIFDEDESPISGVRIELLDETGYVIGSTQTDAQGNYRFINLKPGIYSVREVPPDGYFQGGQTAPDGIADTDTMDLIADVLLSSGESVSELNFCEVPPATIAGYVFQDGAPIETADGRPPLLLKGLRDGIRNDGDSPIGNVVLELRTRTGQRLASTNAMPGVYSSETIRVSTDSSGHYEFRGLRPGAYHVYQVQPKGYFDGRDTAGSIGGFAINVEDIVTNLETQNIIEQLAIDPATSPGSDAILMINLQAGAQSVENNFSEIIVAQIPRHTPPTPPQNPPAPPPPQSPPPLNPPPVNGFVSPPFIRLLVIPPFEFGKPDEPAAGYTVEYTWHLSVINAGEPRGHQNEKTVSRERVANSAKMLNASQWTVDTLDRGRWVFVSTTKNKTTRLSRDAFDVQGAKQLAGDFNGDGRDELALFKDGEWLLDINGNGLWDRGDLW
ncbi:MAG TPA: SdrD B-like domain-containing protein, partial [Pirellula sp.]|nr:SdrD B-like domain-containing protein [Pirellula sp.]